MSRLAYIGIGIAALFILAAIFAPWIATYDVTAQNLAMRYVGPSAEHWFGTDASPVARRARMARRVGSANAAKTVLNWSVVISYTQQSSL